ERKGGLAAQPLEVEFGDELERRPVPELEGAGDQPDAQVLVDQAELGEDLERRRLRGRGARAVVDLVVRLEQRDGVPVAGAGESCDCADGSSADDQNPGLHFSATRVPSKRAALPRRAIPA